MCISVSWIYLDERFYLFFNNLRARYRRRADPAGLVLTLHVQISPGADRRHAAAAEDGLALVVAGVAHHGAEDGQPAVEVAQSAVHQHAVLAPCDAQLDKRPEKWSDESS